jgi:hypothetical protein
MNVFAWLKSLDSRKVRALGCQHKIDNWQRMPLKQLREDLSVLPAVEDQCKLFHPD